jgi:hypothetical protein
MTDEIFECRDPNGVPFAETNNYVDRRWAMKTIAEKDTRIAELEAALRFYADPYKFTDCRGNDIQVPDFYSETDFGETARVALKGGQA